MSDIEATHAATVVDDTRSRSVTSIKQQLERQNFAHRMPHRGAAGISSQQAESERRFAGGVKPTETRPRSMTIAGQSPNKPGHVSPSTRQQLSGVGAAGVPILHQAESQRGFAGGVDYPPRSRSVTVASYAQQLEEKHFVHPNKPQEERKQKATKESKFGYSADDDTKYIADLELECNTANLASNHARNDYIRNDRWTRSQTPVIVHVTHDGVDAVLRVIMRANATVHEVGRMVVTKMGLTAASCKWSLILDQEPLADDAILAENHSVARNVGFGRNVELKMMLFQDKEKQAQVHPLQFATLTSRERYIPFKGWSEDHLFFFDPPKHEQWQAGVVSHPKVLPSVTEGVWEPQINENTDESGWRYQTAFTLSIKNSNSPRFLVVRYKVSKFVPARGSPVEGPASVDPDIFSPEKMTDVESHRAISTKRGFCYRRICNSSSTTPIIFLIHRGPDTKRWPVEPVFKVLTYLGVSCFFDKEIAEGTDSVRHMQASCYGAMLACVFFSENFFKTPWPLLELNTFFQREEEECSVDAARMIHPVFWQVDRYAFCDKYKLSDLQRITSYCASEEYVRDGILGQRERKHTDIKFIMTIVNDLLHLELIRQNEAVVKAWKTLGWSSKDGRADRLKKLMDRCVKVLKMVYFHGTVVFKNSASDIKERCHELPNTQAAQREWQRRCCNNKRVDPDEQKFQCLGHIFTEHYDGPKATCACFGGQLTVLYDAADHQQAK